MLTSNVPNEPNAVENHTSLLFIKPFKPNSGIRVTIKNKINKPVGSNALATWPALTALLSNLFSTFAKPIPLFATNTEIKRPIAPPTMMGTHS